MRYIGSKNKVLGEIDALLADKGLDAAGLSFFDAFAGTAVVAQHYRNRYRIVANDNLYFSYVLAQATLCSQENMFARLGFDPFEYLNRPESRRVGFIAQNYAPALSPRMYFSDANAQKIDFIRTTIDEWHAAGRITDYEKYYLIASLIESTSRVANVAGVYGSYLKKWDPRAVKEMTLTPVETDDAALPNAEVYNEDILSAIEHIEGDILYLDPPYTRNQYSVQYHLPETIARYDAPELRGRTGARDMRALSSDFSKDGYAHVAFEKLIARARFGHIVMSYSSDGIMSREYIESVLKRYGDRDTYEFRKFPYRRYLNNRAVDRDDHCEYLFYIRKRASANYCSPLNFIGGKHDVVDFLKSNMPKDINTFYDLFAGGFNVGINVAAKKLVYNDINFKVRELLEYIAAADTAALYRYLKSAIKRLGLSKENKDAYLRLRNKYNRAAPGRRDCRELFLLIMYGFQQQIRFNGNYDYNNPVGQAGFNDRVLEKLVSYSRAVKEKNVEYHSDDYELFFDRIGPDDFVYIDPPYLITLGSYNDGKRGFNGWNETEEKRLLDFLSRLDAKGVRFMLSNVLHHKDKTNTILAEWVQAHGYKVIEHGLITRGGRNESVIVNYEIEK